jgi:hypothetical protein
MLSHVSTGQLVRQKTQEIETVGKTAQSSRGTSVPSAARDITHKATRDGFPASSTQHTQHPPASPTSSTQIPRTRAQEVNRDSFPDSLPHRHTPTTNLSTAQSTRNMVTIHQATEDMMKATFKVVGARGGPHLGAQQPHHHQVCGFNFGSNPTAQPRLSPSLPPGDAL